MRRAHKTFLRIVAIVCVFSLLGMDLVRAVTNEGYTGLSAVQVTQFTAPGVAGTSGNTFNANFTLRRTDLTVSGRGLPIEITMIYNSAFRDVPSRFGNGWQFGYNIFYIPQPNGDMLIVWGDGRVDGFARNGNQFQPPPGIQVSLEEFEPARFLLTTKFGIKFFLDDPSHRRVARIEEPNGNAITFNYDAGRLVTITDASRRSVLLDYDAQGKLVSITDPNTTPTRVIRYAYDRNGNQVAFMDSLGNVTTYGYDDDHLLTSITDPRGETVAIAYSTPPVDLSVRRLARITTSLSERTFDYDEANRTTTVTDLLETGRQETKYRYDDQGRLVEVINTLGDARTFVWDDAGNVIQITDENGNSTTFSYDAKGNLLTETDPLGKITTFTYEGNFNKISSKTDANGNRTVLQYDTKGNVVGIRDPIGNRVAFAYDSLGQLSSVTDPRGNRTLLFYDVHGSVNRITNALGESSLFTYDNAARLIRLTDPAGNASSLEWDLGDRLVKITDTVLNSASIAYDGKGNPIRIEDGNGNATSFAYDQLGRLVRVTDALGNETRYGYDMVSNLIRMTDANGHTRQFAYDVLNRLISEMDALGNVINLSYDKVGRVRSRTDANGNTQAFSYDEIGQLLRLDRTDGSKVDFAYDAVGNLTRLADDNVDLRFAYDSLNRLLDESELVTGKSVRYTYDAVGNRARMIDTDGGLTTYGYDGANRLRQLTNPLAQTTSFDYDARGGLIRQVNGNGTIAVFNYDPAGRLSSIENRRADGTIISSFSYTHDNVGNRLSVVDQAGDVTRYFYDLTDKLTRVVNPDGSNIEFVYDRVGNRVQMTANGVTTTYTYDSDDRLLQAGSISFSYDNNGNVVRKTEGLNTTTYAYDFEDRLVATSFADGTQNLVTYFPDGRRLSKTDRAGRTTGFFYDGPNPLVEFDASLTTLARFTSGLKIDEWLSMDSGGSSFFYHIDGLTSIRNITNLAGVGAAAFDYDAFGNITRQTGNVTNPFTFTGREFERESGLYYYRARYYDAGLGRFYSKEPVSLLSSSLPDPLGLHRYVYVRNNPVNLTDPEGELFFFLAIIAVSVVTGIVTRAATKAVVMKENFVQQLRREAVRTFTTPDGLADLAVDIATGAVSGGASIAGSAAGRSAFVAAGRSIGTGVTQATRGAIRTTIAAGVGATSPTIFTGGSRSLVNAGVKESARAGVQTLGEGLKNVGRGLIATIDPGRASTTLSTFGGIAVSGIRNGLGSLSPSFGEQQQSQLPPIPTVGANTGAFGGSNQPSLTEPEIVPTPRPRPERPPRPEPERPPKVAPPHAELIIIKEAHRQTVRVGDTLIYRLSVRNLGPSDATDVVITDTLPENVESVAASSGCLLSGSTVTCRIGNLAEGAKETREITVRPTAPGRLRNTATVTANEPDRHPANNTATVVSRAEELIPTRPAR